MTLVASAFFADDRGETTPGTEAHFFSSIKLSNQTFKRTDVGRFADLDRELLGVISKSGCGVTSVLDVAVSSGVTTVELLRALRGAGFAPELTATDLFLDACIVPLGPGCRALVDAEGFPLQYELFGVAVRPWRRRLDFLNGLVAFRWLANRVCGRRARAALRDGRGVRPVRLISPTLLRDAQVRVVRDDVLTPNPSLVAKHDFVRAANILNRNYFDERQLRSAVDNLKSYLKGPGALLLIVRTLGQKEHHGTLFQLAADGRARVLHRFGRGSEVEQLVGAVDG